MVSLIVHEPSAEIAYTGESFVARLNLQRELTQEVEWAARVSQSRGYARLSQMQLDSRGFSCVTALEAEAQQRTQPIELAAFRVLNEKHREKVGAEAAMPDTPKLKPLFGKNPVKGKFSLANLKEKAEPKSLIGALLN